jgi:hypothetical protein
VAHRSTIRFGAPLSCLYGLIFRFDLLLVAVGMAMGAFGTHALRSMSGFSPDRVAAFVTATRYAVNA